MEDDPVLRTFLADNLTADGYELIVAETVRDGLRELEFKQPDLAIVDLGLPDGSGLELIARVRAADGVASRLDPTLPLVVLSGRASELDRVRGFERGADDFVAKPFSYGELRLRLARRAAPDARAARPRAAARRRARARPGVTRGAAARPAGRRCRRRSSRCCARSPPSPTRVLTKEELLRDVWGFRSLGHDPHARHPRLPPAPQARRRRRPLRGQRVGRRLPARRRPGGRRSSRRDRAGSRCSRGRWRPSALHLRGRRRLVLAARARPRGARPAVHGAARARRARARRRGWRRSTSSCGARRWRSTTWRAAARRGRGAEGSVDVGRPAARGRAGLAGARRRRAASTLAIDPPGGGAACVGDRLRLAQACANLVANAIEHGGGRVSRARRARRAARPGRGLRRRPGPAGARSPRSSPRPAAAARRAATASRSRPRSPSATAAGCESAPGRPRGAHLVLDLPAARVSRRRRAALLLGLALVLGALAASDVARREAALREQRRPARRRASSPRATLDAGRRLRGRRPRASAACPQRFAPAGGPRVPELLARPQRLAVPVPRGSAARRAPARARRRRPARRSGAASGRSRSWPRGSPELVVAGARVDVLVTRERGAVAQPELALEDVEVLARARAAREEDGPQVARRCGSAVRAGGLPRRGRRASPATSGCSPARRRRPAPPGRAADVSAGPTPLKNV